VSYPKCYAAVADDEKDQYAIIMEDLISTGFEMWPKQKPMPLHHVERILEELAKMHSVSYALKDQQPAIYNGLKQYTCDFWSTLDKGMKPVVNAAYARAIDVLEKAEHVEILKVLQIDTVERFRRCVDSEAAEPFGVLGHGDCWINNVMFKHAPEMSNLVEICILDWQSRFESPALDLHDVLFTASDKSFRDKHYKNLIRHYHNTLSESIRRLGSDPDKLFTYADLEAELRKTGSYAMIISIITTLLVIPQAKHIPDLYKLNGDTSYNDDTDNTYEPFDEATQQRYRERINGLFTDFMAYGFYK